MSTSIEIPDNIEDFCIACVPVGSRVTCNPPPTDTDQDILCLVEPELAGALREWLDQKGWELEGEYGNLSDFDSYRGDVDGTEYNLILTESTDWFDRFMDATFECKKLNVMDKPGRIAVFNTHMKPSLKSNYHQDLLTHMAQLKAQAALQASFIAAQAQQAQANNMGVGGAFNQVQPQSTGGSVMSWTVGPYHTDDFVDSLFGNPNVTY